MEDELVELCQVNSVLRVNWLSHNHFQNFLLRSCVCLVVSIVEIVGSLILFLFNTYSLVTNANVTQSH